MARGISKALNMGVSEAEVYTTKRDDISSNIFGKIINTQENTSLVYGLRIAMGNKIGFSFSLIWVFS